MKLFKIITILCITILLVLVIQIWLGGVSQDLPDPEQEYFFEPAEIVVSEIDINDQFPEGIIQSGATTLKVAEFLADGITLQDPMNPGDYILAGDLGYCTDDGLCLDNATSESFMVTFHSADGYFNITLFSNPVSYARRDAERFLQDKLSISRSEMCNLSYNIMVPYWINEQFAGQDLRFSFCSDAVSL